MAEIPMHYVCTLDEARALVARHEKFWLSNCGCREGNDGKCERSRIDVCLYFEEMGSSGSGLHSIRPEEARAVLAHAAERGLVPRPFRNDPDRSRTAGVCFCCDDCCSYFQNPEEACDKGRKVERTDMDTCTSCGDCVPACHFVARAMKGTELAVDRARCYGCGVCVDTCPEDFISMVERPAC